MVKVGGKYRQVYKISREMQDVMFDKKNFALYNGSKRNGIFGERRACNEL